MQEIENLIPTRPYMVRAIYEWLEDNQLTPYIMVDTTKPHVSVPTEYIQDGRIVLNIARHATGQLEIDNEFVHFHARFGGISREIWVPMPALMGIYAKENNTLGMFFDPTEYDHYQQKIDNSQENIPKRENTAGLKILD